MAPADAVPRLRLGTRGGDLALWQAAEVARFLKVRHPTLEIEQHIIRTTGDRVAGTPLAQIGGKGLFTKEIEDALASGVIDIAVHSLKDLPTRLPDGLAVMAVLERADPRDVLVASPGTTLRQLPAGTRIGTSSLRRRAQLLAIDPALRIVDVRGNLATRLLKLDRGDVDALVLAQAGLSRLGLESRIAEVLHPDIVVPAVGQGALAVEARVGDWQVASWIEELDHRPTRLATLAERAFLARLEGGCQTPIGALGTWNNGTLTLMGIVADLQGRASVRGTESATVECERDAAAVGMRLADRLLADGARAILAGVRAASASGAEA